MWYCRTRPGVIQGFAAAIGTPDLTAAFDRMSINLPTSSGNPVALERAAQSYGEATQRMEALSSPKDATTWNLF